MKANTEKLLIQIKRRLSEANNLLTYSKGIKLSKVSNCLRKTKRVADGPASAKPFPYGIVKGVWYPIDLIPLDVESDFDPEWIDKLPRY